jgi:hypothetical protein
MTMSRHDEPDGTNDRKRTEEPEDESLDAELHERSTAETLGADDQALTGVDTSRFREHRTRPELNALLHYGHIIPVSKGWTKTYVDTHYPGWTWNALMAIFRDAGIVKFSACGGPPKCDDALVMLHFSSTGDFLVEWSDGTGATREVGRT